MCRFFLLLLCCPAVLAAETSLFDAFVKRCESFSAWSVEARTPEQGGEGVTRVVFAVPDKLRVEQKGGEGLLIVLNGAKGWVYHPAKKVCFVLEEPEVLKQLQKGDLALGAVAATSLFAQMTMRTDARPVEERFDGVPCTRFDLVFGEYGLKLWLERGTGGPVMRGSEMATMVNDVTRQPWSRRQVYTNWSFEKPAEDLFVFTPPPEVKVGEQGISIPGHTIRITTDQHIIRGQIDQCLSRRISAYRLCDCISHRCCQY